MKVKICGLTNVEDAGLALELGADFLGFIFYRKSPRFADVSVVKSIVETFSGSGVRFVGVFVDEALDVIVRVARETGIDGVQLHGNESVADINALKEKGFYVIKAVRVKDESSFLKLDGFEPDRFLLDTWSSDYGGSGKSFDWQILGNKKDFRENAFIAGGIQAESLSRLLGFFVPWGVDVASGVEAFPGKKDRSKMETFFNVIHKKGIR